MPRMLDVSNDVRAEIGDEEASRLIAGENAPGNYDCASCRTPGNTEVERTSTVLFVGQETAVLAFAHASCVPSQVVPVPEEQLQGAVRSIDDGELSTPARSGPDAGPAPAVPPRSAVLNVTCGLILLDEGDPRAALVVEPTAPISRPGSDGPGDDFLPLLLEQGFRPVADVRQAPAGLPGWYVAMGMGRVQSVLMPGVDGTVAAWWQAHQPLPVTDGWQAAATAFQTVMVYAAPAGSIGNQPREDVLRAALDRAAARGVLMGAAMSLSAR